MMRNDKGEIVGRRSLESSTSRPRWDDEDVPGWMTAAPYAWRVSLSLGLECGVAEDGRIGWLACVLPDLVDEWEGPTMVEAPPAVSWIAPVLRVHLGDQRWSVGRWERRETLLRNPDAEAKGRARYRKSQCSEGELADALGLTETPRPARLEWWKAERVMRNDQGGVIGSRKIESGSAAPARGGIASG